MRSHAGRLYALPYAHLRLKRNPFGLPSPEEMPGLVVGHHVSALLEHLEATHSSAHPATIQLIGECGRGKSTTMRAMHARYPDAPFYYYADDRPHPRLPRRLDSHRLLFLDESQRTPWWQRQRLFLSRCALVLGTHADHGKEVMATHRGRHVHTVRIEGFTDEELEAIVERRIRWAMSEPEGSPSPVHVSGALRAELVAAHGDDLRAMFATLYELIETMSAPGELPLLSISSVETAEPSRHRANRLADLKRGG